MPLLRLRLGLLGCATLVLVVLASACSGDDCTGICGCFTDVTVSVSTRVTDPTGAPIAGVELYCDEEIALVATGGADGVISTEITTGESARCGLERCGRLRFEDPSGTYRARLVSLEDVQGSETLVLELSIEPEMDGGEMDGGEMDGGALDAEAGDAGDADASDTDAG